MICILTAGKTLTLAASAFALAWTHSVEKTRWEEHWIAGPEGLTVTQGSVEGSGAGMDPPPDAVLKHGAYVYTPHVPAIPELVLAASGATGAGWTLCPARRGETGEPSGFGADASRRLSQHDDGPTGTASKDGGAKTLGCLTLGTRRQAPIHVRWCSAETVPHTPKPTKAAVDDQASADSDERADKSAAAHTRRRAFFKMNEPIRRPPNR